MGKSKGITTGTFLVGAGILAAADQYYKLQNTGIKVKDLRILKITTKVFRFDLILEIHNRTLIPITITSQAYIMFIMGKAFAKGFSTTHQEIKADATSLLEFQFEIPVKQALKTIKSEGVTLLLTPEKFIITLNMSVTAKVFGLEVKIPYTYVTDLKKLINLKAKK